MGGSVKKNGKKVPESSVKNAQDGQEAQHSSLASPSGERLGIQQSSGH